MSRAKLTKSYFACLFFMMAFLLSTEAVTQNNSYSARFRLASLDTSTRIACYDLQLLNPDSISWRLFAYNFNLFYDAGVGTFVRDSVVNPLHVSESNPVNVTIPVGTVVNSGLTYDSIGFLRISVSDIVTGEGQIFEGNSDWISISQICFFISVDDITSPNTCLSLNFGTPQIRAATNANPDIVLEFDVVTVSANLDPVDRFDVVPDRTLNSCFVLEEDTEDVCSDGIDNDEDGILDCDEPSCSPGVVDIQRVEIECIRPEGSLTLTGAIGDAIQYSIDGGATFSSDSIFDGLEPGVYDVLVTNNDVTSCAFANTVILTAPDCAESDDMSCSDGLDNDGDGLVDCADDSCQPILEDILVRSPIICPSLTDGQIEISTLLTDVEFSIDSGLTYQASNVFDALEAGLYYIFLRNTVTMCEAPSDDNPIELPVTVSCEVPNELPLFFVPNVINPNNPPQNLLSVTSEESLFLRTFAVFDRWGNQVFIRRDIPATPDVGWDGRYENDNVRSGVYVYLLEFDVDGEIIVVRGDVLVIN